MKLKRSDVESMVNGLYRATGAAAFFDAPLLGVAAADDPWFDRFKTVIGSFHWTPSEALALAAPGAEARSVIVWILPVAASVREANRSRNREPAPEWAAMRSFGELCNENIRRQLCRRLETAGWAAAAPHLEQLKRGVKVVELGFASHWSERHAAFVAGLGTFGLSAGLITLRGIAHRVGTVVTDAELEPDVRPYGDDPFAWCTRCGACVRRCPAGAVGLRFEDRDKPKCYTYIAEQISARRAEKYGWLDLAIGCGLCQTAVPCEFKRP